MRALRAWVMRLLGLLSGGRWRERELAAEIESHLQLHIDDNVRAGMSPEDARRAALLKFGPVEATKDEYRDRASLPFFGHIARDLRYALRRWRHRPGFAVTAILILALGIGATTAMFSVVDTVLLRPLPWPEAERLVVAHAVHPERRQKPGFSATWNRRLLSRPAWDALRQTHGFASLAVWQPVQQTIGELRDDVVQTLHVSSNFLPTLGATILHGRHFTPAEDEADSDSVILTHEAWHRWFGARPDIIGQPLTLGYASSGDQKRHLVVGVLTPAFRTYSGSPDVLLPIGYFAQTGRAYASPAYRAVARLADGVSLEAALAEAEPVVRATERREPTSIRLVPIADEYLGGVARPLWLLFGGAALLLLVACSSVAGLLVGEGRARRHEIAVRLSLGAGRARVMRQLLVEHALLAVIGTTAGLVFGAWLAGLFVAMAPEGLPRIHAGSSDPRLAWFAAGLGSLALLLFGAVPAMSLARSVPAGTLAEGGRGAMHRRHLGQRLIVVLQISVALVLIVGACLFGETMYRLTSQPLGFEPSNVAVASTTFTGIRWGSGAAFVALEGKRDFSQRLAALETSIEGLRTRAVLERLAAIPDVIGVAGASAVPFVGVPREIAIPLEGRPAPETHSVHRHVVTRQYFDLMGMRIVEGRGFTASDRIGANAVVVSREFQRRFCPQGAIGCRFSLTWGPEPGQVTHWDVVGVVSNVKQRNFSDGNAAAFYEFNQQTRGVTQFVVRTSGDPSAVLPLMRQVIRDVDPQMVVTSTHALESLAAEDVAEERFRAMLSIAYGGAALLLAAAGLYGLAARRAAERTREFGVRVALGARPVDVRRLVLRDAWIVVGLGLAVGLPAAYSASQVTQSFLFGVSPTAPHVFVLASAVLAAATVLATMPPAHRASRVDPMLALRAE
ncbi:MAG TPA: ADOP family duplicated permease [Vicinamibacterales bacterium]|nr:ADOP family duplicated permease [Vicinamibacterales bacterium]